MIQKLRYSKSHVLYILLAVIGFACIRNFENQLFYDPFLDFFKGNFALRPLPTIVEWKLYLNITFRYFLNTILSLFVIYILFKKTDFVKLSLILYVLFFLILMFVFVGILYFFQNQLMLLFYVRRFLIQPLFLLLFIPGFYFQKQNS